MKILFNTILLFILTTGTYAQNLPDSKIDGKFYEVNRTKIWTVSFGKGEGTTTNQKEYSYIDKEQTNGKYFYRLKQVDYNGSYEYSNVIEVDVRSLDEYALQQNYPNPFNPTTSIQYAVNNL